MTTTIDQDAVRQIVREELKRAGITGGLLDGRRAVGPPEAARLLCTSIRTIGRLLKDKSLPHSVVRGRKKIPIEAIEKLLRDGTPTAESDEAGGPQ